MARDGQDPSEVLKFELEFVNKGGYGRSPREPWRAPLVFEDSPTCMNYDSKDHPEPCEECMLMQFVPPDCRGQAVPCRFIPLNETGETLDDLYSWGTQQDIDEAMRTWLVKTIKDLESQRAQGKAGCGAKPGCDCRVAAH